MCRRDEDHCHHRVPRPAGCRREHPEALWLAGSPRFARPPVPGAPRQWDLELQYSLPAIATARRHRRVSPGLLSSDAEGDGKTRPATPDSHSTGLPNAWMCPPWCRNSSPAACMTRRALLFSLAWRESEFLRQISEERKPSIITVDRIYTMKNISKITILIVASFMILSCQKTVNGKQTWLQQPEHMLFPDDYVYVDITKPPYNADNTGKKDATHAINMALENNGANLGGRMTPGPVIYFPAGIYLVSDTIMPAYTEKTLRDQYEKKNVPESKIKELLKTKKSAPFVRIQGAGKDVTTIKLVDNAKGFRSPKPVVQTGCRYNYRKDLKPVFHQQANAAFKNYVLDLAIDVGIGNPGAVALQFDAANIGAARNLRLIGNKSGLCGITSGEIAGCGLVKNVIIEGFDYGVLHDTPRDVVNNMTYEFITLKNQNKAGIFTKNKNLYMRRVTSRQHKGAPTVKLTSGFASLVMLDLKVFGTQEVAVDLQNSPFMYLRNALFEDAEVAIKNSNGGSIKDRRHVEEYLAAKGEGRELENYSLDLPVVETPYYHTNDMSLWINILKYADEPGPGKDIGPALKKALAASPEGAVLYLPYGQYKLGSDVLIHDTKARKLDLCGSRIRKMKEPKGQKRLIFDSVDNSENEFIICNGQALVNVIQKGNSTLVIQDMFGSMKVTTTDASKGTVVYENCGSHFMVDIKGGNKLYAHSVNPECFPISITDATAWMFGLNWELRGHMPKPMIKRLRAQGRKPRPMVRKGPVKAYSSQVEVFGVHDDVSFDFTDQDKFPDDYPIYQFVDSDFFVVGGGCLQPKCYIGKVLIEKSNNEEIQSVNHNGESGDVGIFPSPVYQGQRRFVMIKKDEK